jgi:phenylacetate-CoA ligase
MKSHFKEIVYLASPVFVQNVLVTIAGLIERHRRYGGNFESFSEELFSNEFASREELAELQQKTLKRVLENATQNVPFYKKLGISTPVLEEFPIVNRSEIAQSPLDFVSNNYRKESLMVIYTGGSTGTPLGVYLTKEIRRKSYAFWNRFYRGFGVDIKDRKATFLGRKIQDPDNNKPPFWRLNAAGNQLLFSSFHMTDENLPYYIKRLNTFRPKIVEGYPQSVFRIAEFICENDIKLEFTPRGISTSSENFTNKQRATMEKAFGCKVYDQYGSAESVIFAGDCEYGNKHIAVEYGVAEVLKEDGSIASEGAGELIVTSLLNDAMPLIRYRIGDLGKISHKSCQCGRNTPILEELSGKVGAVIVSRGKRVSTAAIAFAFEYLESVSKAQIIQNEPEKILVKLVAKEGFAKDMREFMEWELRKMLGQELEIDVELVDDIPSSDNGKYQMVIQNYYKN